MLYNTALNVRRGDQILVRPPFTPCMAHVLILSREESITRKNPQERARLNSASRTFIKATYRLQSSCSNLTP